MPTTTVQLLDFLTALGVETRTVPHPPVFTVEANKALRGDLPGAHAKNLFLRDKKDALWLVVAEEDRDVDLKDLRQRIGAAHLSFGKPELLMDVLGVEPGSVTPFAVINDRSQRVAVVLDAALLAAPLLNFHPLTNTATTAITPSGLLAFFHACGHEPRLVDLATAA